MLRKFNPIELASSDKKSRVYFRHIRWKGKRRCPRCGHHLLYNRVIIEYHQSGINHGIKDKMNLFRIPTGIHISLLVISYMQNNRRDYLLEQALVQVHSYTC